MRTFFKIECRLPVWMFTWALLAGGLSLSMPSTGWTEDAIVSEGTFGCILDMPKVRNTRFKHADPAKLKEAMKIFRESEPDKEYPVGTILQLVPFEAMVKHQREKFPKSNGWEFFALEVSETGTKIIDRGDEKVLNVLLKAPCLSCHQPATKFDFVCEKGHGCAPLSIDDQQIADLQKADLRCTKKQP